MSLFENDEYQWRVTYFIFFADDRRPQADNVSKILRSIDARYEITNLRADDNGRFESLTLMSPDDYAADIETVIHHVLSMSFLTQEQQDDIFYGNAARFIGLEPGYETRWRQPRSAED